MIKTYENILKKLSSLVSPPLEFLSQSIIEIAAMDEARKDDALESFKKVFLQFSDSFYNEHTSEFLRIQDEISDGFIYGIFLQKGFYFFEEKTFEVLSNNDLSLFIIGKLLKNCSMKEILLFLNEFSFNVKGIGKKLLLIEVFSIIVVNIEKKELFIPQVYPKILITSSECVQKYIRLKEKKILADCNNYHAEIWSNFENYMIKLLEKIIQKIENAIAFPSGFISLNELISKNEKEFDQNLLISHYSLFFLSDLTEGVLEAFESGKFEKSKIENLLNTLANSMKKIYGDWLSLVNNYQRIERYLKSKNLNKKKIGENFEKYELIGQFNLHAIVWIIKNEITSDFVFWNFCSTEYRLKLIIPILIEILNEKRSFFKNEIIQSLAEILKDEKYLEENKGKITNLNKYNALLTELVSGLLEIAGNHGADKEKTIVLEITEKIEILLNIEIQFTLFYEVIKKSTNLNLIGYLINEYKKRIQIFVNTNENSSNSFLKSENLVKLVDLAIQKDNFTSLSLKTDLINEILNLLIYVFVKFHNNSESSNLPSNHIFNRLSNENYKKTKSSFITLEKSIDEEIDSLNKKKHELKADKKRNQEEVEKEIENFDIKINQVLILKENNKKLLDLMKEI